MKYVHRTWKYAFYFCYRLQHVRGRVYPEHLGFVPQDKIDLQIRVRAILTAVRDDDVVYNEYVYCRLHKVTDED